MVYQVTEDIEDIFFVDKKFDGERFPVNLLIGYLLLDLPAPWATGTVLMSSQPHPSH
ncbi:MAG: hypothetical protein GY869_19410 [Planctomycetes bacterium]|nr:hypothetical protein [Planctomycetota bacterium]